MLQLDIVEACVQLHARQAVLYTTIYITVTHDQTRISAIYIGLQS